MDLVSEAFDEGGPIPDRYARDGGDVSPPLDWAGVPDGAAELVVTCTDVDVPGEPFVHWLLAGLDPSYDGLGEGEQPEDAVMGVNGYGELGWGGPQPPPGERHRYAVTLVAAAAPLGLASGFDAAALARALGGREIGRVSLTGTFGG